MKLGSMVTCVNKLTFMGFTLEEARLICGGKYLNKGEDSQYKASSECLSYKIPIIYKESPKKSKDEIVAMAAAWCEEHGNPKQDADQFTPKIPRVSAVSRTRLGRLVKNIETHKGLKVGAMGLLPFKTHRPMKNLNRLQTKLEKLWTLEEKWLTSEQLEQRRQYMLMMKKEDSEVTVLFKEFIDSISEDLNISTFEVGLNLAELMEDNRDWNYIGDSSTIDKFVILNNMIKVPIIIAMEMIQEYEDDKTGTIEKHFKSYKELKMAISKLDSVPMTIEHVKIIEDFNTIGYVKDFRKDDKTRSIRGMGYFKTAKLPQFLIDAIKRGEKIGVSIGFICRLGDSGIFNGELYNKNQEEIIINHVAICIDSTPRCPLPFCGINLDSTEYPIKSIDDVKFTILNKDNYIINICKLKQNIKSHDNNVNSEKSDEEIKRQDSDSTKIEIPTIEEFEDAIATDDFKAILKRLLDFIHGKNIPVNEDLQTYISRILKAFDKNPKGDKKKMSDNKALEEQLKTLMDSTTKKDEKIEEMMKLLKDADKFKKEILEERRQDKIKVIKDLADEKFKDEYFEDKSLKDLTLIADAVLKFTPSQEKAKVLPVKGKVKKEDATEELEDETGAKDKYNLKDAWNKTNDMYGFDLSQYESKE